MSFLLGVGASSTAPAPGRNNSFSQGSTPSSGSSPTASTAPTVKSPGSALECGSLEVKAGLKESKASRKTPSVLSSRAWVTRDRAKSSGPTPSSASTGPVQRPVSSSTASVCSSSPHDSFDLPFSPPAQTGRPKHVPIVIPKEYSYVPSLNKDTGSAFIPDCNSLTPQVDSAPPRIPPLHEVRSSRARSTPRYVEIKIPYDWADSTLKDSTTIHPPSRTPPQPPNSNVSHISQSKSSSPRASAMDSQSRRTSPPRSAVFRDDQESDGNSHVHQSHSDLLGSRSDYESASEAETEAEEATDAEAEADSTKDEGPNAHAPSQPAGEIRKPNASSLASLFCNVHRTTGKEPHPLSGATTTILGDKLYVFGGRRLSRTMPHLTSNLYELDLLRRHWTKLETKGDIPLPRYFHSMCALGSTKLVCYGGMSPAPTSDTTTTAQPEMIVMSDIHIYDVESQTWTKINTADAPQGRYAHCATILPSSAVFASATAPMSAVRHNPAGPQPHEGSLGVALDGAGGAEMVIVGGQDSANHYIEQVSVFNLRSLKWTGTTGMGRSCGAYRSVVTTLPTMHASEIGAGPHGQYELEDDEDELSARGSGAPMLIYSNYNFLDVKLELQVRLTDGTLTDMAMQTDVSPLGLRFPNGGVIDNHFVVSGTYLTSTQHEYALWALDLRTLTWSRVDAGGKIFSQGSWNRGVLWNRRNAFVVLGNRRRSLVDDYNNRRINFSNICVIELEAFGLYENPKTANPTSNSVSASSPSLSSKQGDVGFGRLLSSAAEDLGVIAMNARELADMDFLAMDGTKVPVNSRLISRRWGPHFISLFRESVIAATESDMSTLRPSAANNQQNRNSAITIKGASVGSGGPSLAHNNYSGQGRNSVEIPDTRSSPPSTRPRLLYLPHSAPTLRALLHYLYTSSLPVAPHPLATSQVFCSLLQLARPYKIDGLQEAVLERLHESLDGRNAAAIFNATAMGAGGGTGARSPVNRHSIADKDIPIRTASLAGLDSLVAANGIARQTGLRIDTEMANGRSTRSTMRQGQAGPDDTDEDDVPDSAATDTSWSENELTVGAGGADSRPGKQREVWTGVLSSVVGLQKRGLRGLMESRRMRERGRVGVDDGARVGLGIA